MITVIEFTENLIFGGTPLEMKGPKKEIENSAWRLKALILKLIEN